VRAPLLLALSVSLPACGLETLAGDALSGGRFVEYVPAAPDNGALRVRVGDRPGASVELAGASALADDRGWATLVAPSRASLRFALVRSGPLAAMVPPGATAIALDDRTTADVRFLEALGGDLAGADGGALMGLLNDVRGVGGAYYAEVTRELLGLPSNASERLAALVRGRAVTPCVDEEVIRVAFVVEMREGMRDGNCAPIDRHRWAADIPDASMFLAGGVHESYEGGEPLRVRAAHAALGAWMPNLVPMVEVGDGLWQATVDVPRSDPPLRLGYKYTWGLPGAPWTAAEEWPGNQRILSVQDANGDGLVVVRDRFGDEASNKDRQNLRRGGTGSIDFSTDSDEDGWPDAGERPADVDGDCVDDGFPEAFGVAPVLGDCPDPAPPPVPDAGDGPVSVLGAEAFFNGGGEPVVVRGEGFVGGVSVAFGGRPASAVFVRGPTELVAVPPRLPEGTASLTVAGVPGPDVEVAGPGASAPACRLHDSGGLDEGGEPLSGNVSGATVRLVARVAGVDPARCELGWGPAGTDPAADLGWTFAPGVHIGRAPPPDGDEGQCVADLSLPGAGAWAAAFRVAGEGGRAWRYCDGPVDFEVAGAGN